MSVYMCIWRCRYLCTNVDPISGCGGNLNNYENIEQCVSTAMVGACCYRTFTTTRDSIVGNTQNLQMHCRVGWQMADCLQHLCVCWNSTLLKLKSIMMDQVFVLSSACQGIRFLSCCCCWNIDRFMHSRSPFDKLKQISEKRDFLKYARLGIFRLQPDFRIQIFS